MPEEKVNTNSGEASAAPASSTQTAFFECTRLYRVFLSKDVFVQAQNAVALKPVKDGVDGAGEMSIFVNDTDQIVVREGFVPGSTTDKALFLIRVPLEFQIFKPKP